MATKTFTKDEMLGILYGPRENILENKLTDSGRWHLFYDLTFKASDGKFYSTYYSVGATEYQPESPWEFEDTVECVEVHQVEKVVLVWEAVK